MIPLLWPIIGARHQSYDQVMFSPYPGLIWIIYRLLWVIEVIMVTQDGEGNIYILVAGLFFFFNVFWQLFGGCYVQTHNIIHIQSVHVVHVQPTLQGYGFVSKSGTLQIPWFIMISSAPLVV